MAEKSQPMPEVMDLATACHSFPRLREPLILRDNILDAIDRMFEGEIELVAVEGNEGIGKTTLLAYPILAWVIENAVQRFSNTDQANTSLRQVLEATFLAADISARMATRFSEQINRVKSRMEREGVGGTLLVRAGDRERALQFLQDWFAHQVKDYLKICDEYFGPADIEVLMLLPSGNPKCKVSILASKKHYNQEGILSPDDEYPQHWRRISDQDPPETEIVIVGIESSGKSPIHDRWWLTKGSGLKMGTSFNSLGKTQESTITPISEPEAKLLESDVDQYLVDKKRYYNGERLRYLSVTL